jgi:hypothetical protein
MLLLSNGWLALARYPRTETDKPASDRYNVWWQLTGQGDVIDASTFKGQPTGLYPVGWWNVPDQDWAWETAQRLRPEGSSGQP